MILKSKIFRAYDIRGKAFEDFDSTGFFLVAQAFGQYIAQKWNLKNPKIFVSGDGRLSMPQLFPAVIKGLKQANCEVVWGGKLTTPINFFAFHEGHFDGAIQISASHNPAQDNGIKLMDKGGSVCGDEIQEIFKITQTLPVPENASFETNITITDFADRYTKKLLEITKPQNHRKIVVDAGNGIPGSFYPDIFRAFGHEVIELFCDPDGNFPNHQPDPERPENLKSCQKKVLETNADFGFVFDGDGDRVGIILQDGTTLNADKILYVLAADFLARNPNEKIILDIMSSQTILGKIRALNGNPILAKTGHSYIEEAMHKHNALFGGEQSGHFMFGENFYGHDDAMLASLRFLAAVEDAPGLLNEITENWTPLLEFSERLDLADEKKFKAVKKMEKELLKIFPAGQINLLDGIRINFNEAEWAIIRCSNTSPKMVIRIETRDESSLNEKRDLLLGLMKQAIED